MNRFLCCYNVLLSLIWDIIRVGLPVVGLITSPSPFCDPAAMGRSLLIGIDSLCGGAVDSVHEVWVVSSVYFMHFMDPLLSSLL